MEVAIDIIELIEWCQSNPNDPVFPKAIAYSRKEKCPSCSPQILSSPKCFSCKGKGIKVDPLFKKEKRCNTCKGLGHVLEKECGTCEG